MKRMKGELITNIIDELGQEQKEDILNQLIGILEQPHSHPLHYFGGFQLKGEVELVSGPIVWDFWQEWDD